MRDFELHRHITWRRVIADEAHQLNATGKLPAAFDAPGRAARDTAVMRMLACVPAARGRWLLTGTPLKNLKQPAALNRLFFCLRAGFSTAQLTNMQFVHVMRRLSIRFTKDGLFQVRARGA